MEERIFRLHYEANYKRNEQLSQNRDKKRIESIIKARKIQEDTLHKKLAPLMENDSKLKVKYHLFCALALINIVPLNPLFKISQRRKKRRQSDETKFDPQTQCLYCVSKCEVKRDPKHPSRWRPSFLVAYYYCQICEKEIKYMKYLEQKYYQRSDEWGDEVLLRLAGVRNDFVAADGRTHKDCKTKFH